MLSVVYYASQLNDNIDVQNDYQIAIGVCFIALAATFMASQSCIIGMKFS